MHAAIAWRASWVDPNAASSKRITPYLQVTHTQKKSCACLYSQHAVINLAAISAAKLPQTLPAILAQDIVCNIPQICKKYSRTSCIWKLGYLTEQKVSMSRRHFFNGQGSMHLSFPRSALFSMGLPTSILALTLSTSLSSHRKPLSEVVKLLPLRQALSSDYWLPPAAWLFNEVAVTTVTAWCPFSSSSWWSSAITDV